MQSKKNRNLYYEDEFIENKFNLFMLGRMIAYAGTYKWTYLGMLILLIANSLLSLLPVMINKKIIDEVLPRNGSLQPGYLQKTVIFLIMWSIISIFYVIVNFITSKMANALGNDVICNLRGDLFEHLMKLEFDYYDGRPAGKILVRVTSYIDEIADFFINDMIRVAENAFTLCLSLVLISVTNATLGLLTLGMSIPLAALMWCLAGAVYKRVTLDRNKYSNRTAFLAESINGLEVIQAFGREEVNEQIFADLSGQYHKAYMRTTRFRELFFPLSHGGVRIATSIVIYIAALFLITGKTGMSLSIGVLALITNYIQSLSNAMNVICQRIQNLTNVTSNMERIFDILDTEPKIRDHEGSVELQTPKGEIEFQGVTFSYETGETILENMNLNVRAGEMVALVGPTGAGKTTIVSLLSRFYDVPSGRILIDGQEIRAVRLESLRSEIGVMMQDTFLFGGTILDNIRFAKAKASDEECMEAARKALAHEFIMKLEHGYYTEITSQNTSLSAGERQLLSFARLMLKDAPVVILDEATSSIDTQTEQNIQRALEKVLKNRTSFVIAHRLSTIQNADRILYIDEKGICEDGNHEELIARRGLYWKLYTAG